MTVERATLASTDGAFFRPKSIAIIGATESRGLAKDLLLSIDTQGFAGETWYVNPNREQVFGRPCFPSVLALPGIPDLAIVLLDREATLLAIEECRQLGIQNVVICSAGFAEVDEKGRELEAQLRALVDVSGMRILGPNTIGFLNPADRVPAIAIPPASIPDVLRAGSVAVVSQSAGLMISTMELGARLGLGFRLLASTGNAVDIGAAECVRWLARDAATDVIALILEGIDDGRDLLDAIGVARSAGKAVIGLFLGVSDMGHAAALTHTASIAPAPDVLTAAMKSAGVIRVGTVTELVDRATLLSKRSPRAGGGLAIVTLSGGTKVLAADICERYDVRLADLGEATLQRLSNAIPSIGTAGNPLDVTAAAIEDAGVLRETVRALADDPDVGQIALVMHLRRSGGSDAHKRLITAFLGCAEDVEKQLAIISSIPEGLGGHWFDSAAGTVPMLNDISSLAAIGDLQRYEEGSSRASVATPVADLSVEMPRELAGPTLTEMECYPILESAGIKVARYAVVSAVGEALDQAARIGYPIALKFQSRTFPHRDQVGLIALGIASADELARSFVRLSERAVALGDKSGTFIVQRQVERSPELIVGTRLDDHFGPVVVVGSGGVLAEVGDDVQVRLAPISTTEALDALKSLRMVGWMLEKGQLSDDAVDSAAVVVSRLSRLASQLQHQISSLEINPLLLRKQDAIAVDALATVSEARAKPR